MAEAAESSVTNVFTSYQAYTDTEQTIREDIRESAKDLERSSKYVFSILQGIHLFPKDLNKVCEKARNVLESAVKSQFKVLETKIPAGQYFHYHDIWRHLMNRLAGSCALIHYLETEDLADRDTVADMLGLKTTPKEANLYLDMEDFLQGLLQMGSELSRFTVNCVTNGDYARPARISKFMCELNNGFRELNFKNDFLRKRFDGLKYDIRKIEEVVYDVAIRGLSAPNNHAGSVKTEENSETGTG